LSGRYQRTKKQTCISATDVFDIFEKFLTKKYDALENFEMPYCSLVENPSTKKREYRVQIKLRFKNRIFSESLVATVDPETGNITSFKEGYSWDKWE
jgi:hypothetical protein